MQQQQNLAGSSVPNSSALGISDEELNPMGFNSSVRSAGNNSTLRDTDRGEGADNNMDFNDGQGTTGEVLPDGRNSNGNDSFPDLSQQLTEDQVIVDLFRWFIYSGGLDPFKTDSCYKRSAFFYAGCKGCVKVLDLYVREVLFGFLLRTTSTRGKQTKT